MLFSVIVLIILVGCWTLLSTLSWIALSLPRRAHGALWAAPCAELGGVGAATLVPLAGLDNELGLGLSMLAALIGSALLCWLAYRAWDHWRLDRRVRRWSRRARPQR